MQGGWVLLLLGLRLPLSLGFIPGNEAPPCQPPTPTPLTGRCPKADPACTLPLAS